MTMEQLAPLHQPVRQADHGARARPGRPLRDPQVEGMTRAYQAEIALALRAEGALMREIAATMGISISYASELVNDPSRSKTLQRRRGYQSPCPQCGTLMNGSNGRGPAAPTLCFDCRHQQQRDNAVWTRESVVEAVRWGYSVLERPLRTRDFHPVPLDGLPGWATLRKVGLTSSTACEEAGVPFHSGYRGFGARGGDTSHGTTTHYKRGCRCAECTAAHSAYSRERYRRRRLERMEKTA